MEPETNSNSPNSEKPRLPQRKESDISPEVLHQIDTLSRSILEKTILDQFPYYSSSPDRQSTLPRMNCIDQDWILKGQLNSDPLTADLTVDIVPFEADSAVFSPSQKARYPYAHTGLLISAGDQRLGLVDPTFGIFTPLSPGEITNGRNWELTVIEQDGHPHLVGTKAGRKFDMRFYPENPLATKADLELHKIAFARFMVEGHGSYAFAQSPKDGTKLSSLDVDRFALEYRLTPESPKVHLDLGDSTSLPEVNDPLLAFCAAVNRFKSSSSLEMNPEQFIFEVKHFINLTRSLPPPPDLQ